METESKLINDLAVHKKNKDYPRTQQTKLELDDVREQLTRKRTLLGKVSFFIRLIPEVCGSNPVIGKLYILRLSCQL